MLYERYQKLINQHSLVSTQPRDAINLIDSRDHDSLVYVVHDILAYIVHDISACVVHDL